MRPPLRAEPSALKAAQHLALQQTDQCSAYLGATQESLNVSVQSSSSVDKSTAHPQSAMHRDLQALPELPRSFQGKLIIQLDLMPVIGNSPA